MAYHYFNAKVLAPEFHGLAYRDGISGIDAFAAGFARAYNRRLQLVASIDRVGDTDQIGIVVGPAFVPADGFLATVHREINAIVVDDYGPAANYSGPGAGPEATAAALLGDLSRIAAKFQSGSQKGGHEPAFGAESTLIPYQKIPIRAAFVSRSNASQCGVLRAKLSVLADRGFSVEQFADQGTSSADGTSADILVCNAAPLEEVLAAKLALEALPCTAGHAVKVIRVLGSSPVAFS